MAFECVIEGGARLTQGFGCTHLWIEPACGACDHWHSGWDLAADQGREVYASCDGVVVGIGDDPGYGANSVFIQRNQDGMVELYGHLQDNVVSVLQTVSAGQVIGHVGSRGNSTGPHVHYSVRPPDDRQTECRSVDPAPYLCSCSAIAAPPARLRPAPPSGLAVLLLLGAGPVPGLSIYSPAGPGLR